MDYVLPDDVPLELQLAPGFIPDILQMPATVQRLDKLKSRRQPRAKKPSPIKIKIIKIKKTQAQHLSEVLTLFFLSKLYFSKVFNILCIF